MKAFIFDFDGVIVDSELYWDQYSFETYRAIIPTFTEEDDRELKGRSVLDIYGMMVQKHGLQMSREEYLEHVQRLTDKIYGELCNPLPGLDGLLKRLHELGVAIGIASSSQRVWIEPTLTRLGYADTFPVLVTAADVGIGKPDPAVYVEAARQLGHDPADCVALEDSTNGVAAAKSAGMTCIGIHHEEGYRQNLDAADVQVRHLDDITAELLQRF